MAVKTQLKKANSGMYIFLESRVELIEKACINEVDKYLNEYLFEQVLDMGTETLDIEMDTYYYWNEQDGAIDSCLKHTQRTYFEENEDKKIGELILRLLKLKRIAHAKMKETDFYAEVMLKEKVEIKEIENNKELELIKLNPVLNKEASIKTIYDILISANLIDTNLTQFKRHFIPSEIQQEKLKWLGTEVEIVQLFNTLFNQKIITRELAKKNNILICYHFNNKRNRNFKAKQLSVVPHKSTTDESFQKIIDSIVKSI